MKFGPVPVAAAEGAILAHSVRLLEGRLRKGLRLERSHLGALIDAGYQDIVVARLDTGDLHEDEAATALATALADGCEATRLSAAFTGRVNLIAEHPGVVRIDEGAIHAANAIDPAITVATVAPFSQLRKGGMLATIKIIPYGVANTAVARAIKALRSAISLSRPVCKTASLVVSDISGGTGRKGLESISNRLKNLEVELIETVTCPHSEQAIAGALREAKGEIILVLTGSATSDDEDTAPSALRLAGGALERFGMPVDPGNLLFLGSLNARPVIGLPGSARSPVLHGADWILSRVVCGVEVTSADIARMGVGGLLKEIPTRPQPRSERRRTSYER